MERLVFLTFVLFAIALYNIINYGLVEATYSVLYMTGFLVIAHTLIYLSRRSILLIKHPVEISGRVVETSVQRKSIAQFMGNRGGAAMYRSQVYFNTVDVLSHSGKLYKVFVSYSDSYEYDDPIEKGKLIDLTVRKYSSGFFLSEPLFNKFYGIDKGWV